jgi:elongation factor Ts
MSTPITAALVNDLRKRTDLPMMECKAALTATGGNVDEAIDWLRKNGAKVSGKRAGNETTEGRVCIFIDAASATAAVVELRCESAPVAKSDHFIALGSALAESVATNNPADVAALMASTVGGKAIQDRFTDVISLLRENMKVQRFVRLTGGAFGQYVHHDGSLGVLLQVNKPSTDDAVLRDVCMHIAAVQPTPVAAVREEVPAEIVAKEKEIAKAKAEATGKPAQIAEKIAEGQLKTWYAENVLVEQPFVKDAAKSVGAVLKGVGVDVTKFVRIKVGEIA